MGNERDEQDDNKAAPESNSEDAAGVRDGPDQAKNGSDEATTAGGVKPTTVVDDHDKTSDGDDHQGDKNEDDPAPGSVKVAPGSGEESAAGNEKIAEVDSGSGEVKEGISAIVESDGNNNKQNGGDHPDNQDSANAAKEDTDKKEEAKVAAGDESGTAPAGEEGHASAGACDGNIEVRRIESSGVYYCTLFILIAE